MNKRHRPSPLTWPIIAVVFVLLAMFSCYRQCRGQTPQYHQPQPAVQPVFPCLDRLAPHYPGLPYRNFVRVNVFGLPPYQPWLRPPLPVVQPMTPGNHP